MTKIIVDSSFGSFYAYHATLENAKKILERNIDNLFPEAMDIYKNKTPILIKEDIIHVLEKILNQKEGEMASKTIMVTKENKQELVMYCFEKGISIEKGKIAEFEFFEKFKISDLSFFANNEKYNKDARFEYESTVEQARKYGVIMEDRWKAGASEEAKIKYVLNFAKELGHRDEKYDLVDLEEVVN